MKESENIKKLSVPNAGIVLLSSLFPPLFEQLGLLNSSGKDFKDIDSKICAIFAIQYLVNKKYNSFPSEELELNGLFVDYPFATSLSTDFHLRKHEIELLDQLLLDVKILWNRLTNTSITAMQYSFFLRSGELVELEKEWTLTVESKAFDKLIQLPLEYRYIDFPWMKKPIRVIWN